MRQKLNFFLETLSCSFPFRVVYPQPDLLPGKETILLVQAEQENQKLSRKAFMLALTTKFNILFAKKAKHSENLI